MNKWTLFVPTMFALELLRRRGLRIKLAAVSEHRPLTTATRVLDVGAGVGTVLAELARYGCQLSAIEPTPAMLSVARRRFPNVTFFDDPAHAMRSIADASQDVSFICSTLHGFEPDYRRKVYAELRRVTRELVVVIDYHRNHNPLVALAEWIEGGDYFRFVKVVDEELAAAFPSVQAKRFPGDESLFLCWTR